MADPEVTRTAGTVRAWAARWPPATCRRASATFAGFAVAAAVTIAPLTSSAQILAPDSGANLLQPSLDGNPKTPPRFRRPGERAPPAAHQPPAPGKFTARSRVGATPIYGSPTGFGAGDTGFDSSNTPRRKKRARAAPTSGANALAPQPETTFAPVPTLTPPGPPKPAPPKTPPPAPPAQVYPAKAAARPGAILPPPPDEVPISNPPPEVHPLAASTRLGGALPVPPPLDFEVSAGVLPPPTTPPAKIPVATPPPTAPPLNTLLLGMLPQRPLPIAEGDPYAALGIRAGSFLLFPSLDLSGAYSSNPERVPGAPASYYAIAAPELVVQSDWERHSLTADVAGSYTEYSKDLVPSLNVPYLNAKIDGRIDVARDTQVYLENRFLLTTDNPGSPNLQAQLAKLPIDTDAGATLGLVQELNRLYVGLFGTFDRAVYYNSLLTDGEEASNSDRNFNQTAGILRVGYDLDPGLKPFVQVQGDERVHDEQFDRNGLQRSSVGTSAQVGADIDLFGSLTGEMAGGWLIRSYQDPTLPNISGFIANGTLIWQATALTTAKLGASSEVYETIVQPASGQFTHDVSLEVDHAFLRWLVGTLKAGYGTDNYVGSPLKDTRYFVSAGLIYKMTRDMQIKGEVRQDWQAASEPAFAYMATSFLLGLRLQR